MYGIDHAMLSSPWVLSKVIFPNHRVSSSRSIKLCFGKLTPTRAVEAYVEALLALTAFSSMVQGNRFAGAFTPERNLDKILMDVDDVRA